MPTPEARRIRELETEIEALRDKRRLEKLKDSVFYIMLGLVVVLSIATLWTQYNQGQRDQRRSITIEALEAFAQNGNCQDFRTDAFQDMILVYLDSPNPQDRQTAKEIYKDIDECPEVNLPKP